jgi:CheY-like chemotaxis protein
MKKINCILLVDDNPGDNYFNAYIIKDADICNHTPVAINGFEALDYLRKSEENQTEFPNPDIIILDINMPRMNGFEFLEQYNHLDGKLRSKTPIVMLTTSANPEDRRRAKTYEEVSDFKLKPLSVEMLNEIIEKHY